MPFYVRKKGLGLILAIVLGTGWLTGCQQTGETKPKAEAEAPAPAPTKEQRLSVEKFNQTAEEMYNKVTQGDPIGGRAVLQRLGGQLPQIHYEGITTTDGINALTETVTEAQKVFNAVRFSPEKGQMAAAQIRLAADALTHKEQPMWLQYYKLLQDDIDRLELAVKGRQERESQSAAQQLEQRVSVIRASLVISRGMEDVVKLDSLVRFITSRLNTGNQAPYEQIMDVLHTLRQHIDKLFLKKEATAYLPLVDEQNPILWILAIGSVIIAALSYAGWRLARKDNGVITVRKRDKA